MHFALRPIGLALTDGDRALLPHKATGATCGIVRQWQLASGVSILGHREVGGERGGGSGERNGERGSLSGGRSGERDRHLNLKVGAGGQPGRGVVGGGVVGPPHTKRSVQYMKKEVDEWRVSVRARPSFRRARPPRGARLPGTPYAHAPQARPPASPLTDN